MRSRSFPTFFSICIHFINYILYIYMKYIYILYIIYIYILYNIFIYILYNIFIYIYYINMVYKFVDVVVVLPAVWQMTVVHTQ